jgi:hypothetical protein
MTSDQTIYLKQELQKAGSGPQLGKLNYEHNYAVYFGPIEVKGRSKRPVIEQMIKRLRKMNADGGLNGELSTPAEFESYDRCIIPAHILNQSVDDFIDYDELKFVSAE